MTVQTFKVCSAISGQRSTADLLTACEQYLGQYLGFEGVGLLFRDTKNPSSLFGVTQNYNEQEIELMERIRIKKQNKEALTADEKIQDLTRQLKPGTRQQFPISEGLVG